MIVPRKKKKEIYEERHIVVCLGGLGLMAVIAGEPVLSPQRGVVQQVTLVAI